MHGGKAGTVIQHGRYSLAHRASLAAKRDAFLADPRPGDLSAELAMMRAILQEFLDRFPEGVPMRGQELAAIVSLIREVASLVERIHRILSQTALTQAEVSFLQARLADLLLKYVDDPERRLACLDELRAAVEPAGLPAGPARPA